MRMPLLVLAFIVALLVWTFEKPKQAAELAPVEHTYNTAGHNR